MSNEPDDSSLDLQRDLQRDEGNAAGMTQGGRSQRVALKLTPEQADAVAALPERNASIVSDCGGIENVGALKRSLIERHARLEIVESCLWAHFTAHGALTAAALSAYLGVTDRLMRSALTLGLERKGKRTLSLADSLNGHV